MAVKKAKAKAPARKKKTIVKVKEKRLSSKHKQVVDLIFLDPKRRATQAYMKVYGCSEVAAASSVSNILRIPKVNEYWEKKEEALQNKLRKRYNITEDRILEEMSMLAFTRMSDIADWDADGVTFKDSDELDEFVKAGVIEIVETTTQFGGSLKVKLADKKSALDILGKYTGTFTEKVDHQLSLAEELVEFLTDLPKTTGIPSTHGTAK